MGVLGALLVRQMFLAAVELGAPAAAAAGCALAGGLSLPLLAYTTQLYTELPAALLLLLALRMLFTSSWPAGARAGAGAWRWPGLPWLHDKYYLLQMLVVAAAAVRLRRAPPAPGSASGCRWQSRGRDRAGTTCSSTACRIPSPTTARFRCARAWPAAWLACGWTAPTGFSPTGPRRAGARRPRLLWRRGPGGALAVDWHSPTGSASVSFPRGMAGFARAAYWVPVMPLWVVGPRSPPVAAAASRAPRRSGLLAAGVAIGAYNMTTRGAFFADAPPLGTRLAGHAYRRNLQHPGRRDAPSLYRGADGRRGALRARRPPRGGRAHPPL